jgi:hypothetical protein
MENRCFKTGFGKRFMAHDVHKSTKLALGLAEFEVLKRARFTRPY